MGTLLGLSALCLAGALACAMLGAHLLGESVADKVTRLQIVAHSDSEADQALKLAVRDRVLAITSRVTADCRNADEAEARLAAALPEIGAAAQETVYACGRVYPARVSLGRTGYPFRDYGSFALPAGEYTALRVVLGDGLGHNWWCVAFPSLCEPAAAVDERARAAGFSPREIAFIRSDGAKGRFFLVDLWQRLFRSFPTDL